MAKSLIIVESPAKTKTLKNFLGNDYVIEASMGHVRDLPEHGLGVDIKKDAEGVRPFTPTYEPHPDRKDVLKRLAAAAKGVQTVYLASDPDREGEAIAWHLAEALQLKNPRRIQFNEITRQAVQQALQHPRTVNMDRVNAQQARRVLDRLIGYKLSPILSSKIQSKLSAGRVQSVAVRMICDREREIQAFVPQEYWSLTATLTPVKPEKRFPFAAKLHSRGGQRVEPKSEEEINRIQEEIDGAHYTVFDVKRREQKRNAAPPFITSTLQQEAARKLGFSNKRTMSVAQGLYEGVEIGAEGSVGLITYMRTDSVRIANEAQVEARQFIAAKYGAAYVPATAKQFKTKGEAQDAHEAIRPTSAYREPEKVAQYLSTDQLRLYRLIWQRFVASQMNPAVMDVTTADIAANSGHQNTLAPYLFRSTGSIVKFDGFMRVYTEGKDTEEVSDDEQPPLPPLAKDQPLELIKMEPRQHFTEPPPRYTEATIVKALEEKGIGRPSTYASIISTIVTRKYVELAEKRFRPTELGFTVTEQLVKHFPEVMDIQFTADMETKLDEVEEGKVEWPRLLNEFYDPFEQLLARAKVEMVNLKPAPVETEYHCPVTGNVMLQRQSRFGSFISCSGFPKCKKILKLNPDGTPVEGPDFICGLDPRSKQVEAVKAPAVPATLPDGTSCLCPKGLGVMVLRQRKKDNGPFLGCSAYPICNATLKLTPDGTLQEGQVLVCKYKAEAAAAADQDAEKGTKNGHAPAKAGTRATTKKATASKTAASKTAAKSKAVATKTPDARATTPRKTATTTTATTTTATTTTATTTTAATTTAATPRAAANGNRRSAATGVANENDAPEHLKP
jgi:DNA topoisomerase-1